MAQHRHRVTYFASDEASRKGPFELLSEPGFGKTNIRDVRQVGANVYEISFFCQKDDHDLASALEDHGIRVLSQITDGAIVQEVEQIWRFLFPEFKESCAAE